MLRGIGAGSWWADQRPHNLEMGLLYEVGPDVLRHDRKIRRLLGASSVPPGLLVLIMLGLSLPASFPYQRNRSEGLLTSFDMAGVRKIDFLGAFLLLAASVLLVVALEEGGTEYPWKSATVLSLFCVSILLWIIFFILQKSTYGQKSKQEPVLPWRLLTNRHTMGFLL